MANKKLVIQDDRGFPLFLAEPHKKSGPKNQLPDDSKAEIVTPDGTSGPAEWGRYHDAVREAARTYDDPDEGDVHHFLNARARNPERVDRAAFHEAVKRQRMADLVDITDHHMRRDGSLPRGSRHVRVQAPKGYLRKALRKASPEDVAHLRHRLTAIGHSQDHTDKFLGSRVSSDMWDQATTYEVRMSDEEFEGLVFDADDYGWEEWENPLEDVIEAIKNIKPEIHIHIDKEAIE